MARGTWEDPITAITGAIERLEARGQEKASVKSDALSGKQFHQPALFHTLRGEGGTDFQYYKNAEYGDVGEDLRREVEFSGGSALKTSTADHGNISEFSPNTDAYISGTFGQFNWPGNKGDQRAVGERLIEREQSYSYSDFPEVIGGRAPATPQRPTGVEWSERESPGGQVKRAYTDDTGLKVGEVNYTPKTAHGNLVHTAEVHPGYRRMGLSSQFMGDFIKEHPDTYADAYSQEGELAFKRKGIPEIS